MSNDNVDFAEGIGIALSSIIGQAADENARVICVGAVEATNAKGETKLVKLTLVAETTVYGKTCYPEDEANTEAVSKGMEVTLPITSVVEQLKMFEKESENSIRH